LKKNREKGLFANEDVFFSFFLSVGRFLQTTSALENHADLSAQGTGLDEDDLVHWSGESKTHSRRTGGVV